VAVASVFMGQNEFRPVN